MSDSAKNLVNSLLFSKRGYLTEEEIKEESYFWYDTIIEIQEILSKINLNLKEFTFEGKKCYSIMGDNKYSRSLNEIQCYILLDFIIRWEVNNQNPKGILKDKWRQYLDGKKISRTELSTNLSVLIKKNILMSKGKYIKPNWKYYSLLDIKEILREVEEDSVIQFLKEEERDGS